MLFILISLKPLLNSHVIFVIFEKSYTKSHFIVPVVEEHTRSFYIDTINYTAAILGLHIGNSTWPLIYKGSWSLQVSMSLFRYRTCSLGTIKWLKWTPTTNWTFKLWNGFLWPFGLSGFYRISSWPNFLVLMKYRFSIEY